VNESVGNNTHKALWQSFKMGDKASYNAILQQFYPKLLNYGLRWGLDKILLEDCLQDFFLDIWQKREGLGDVQNLNAYLVSSFRRRLFREKEKRLRLGSSVELQEDYNFDVEFDIETSLIDDERNSENTEKLKYHLDNLTKRQKEAIYLRFYQELDYSEIAQIMNINAHSAVNLVYDALRLMRKNWISTLIIMLVYFF
jgi:RNA polymerase sigma factor (sigma-70 family)